MLCCCAAEAGALGVAEAFEEVETSPATLPERSSAGEAEGAAAAAKAAAPPTSPPRDPAAIRPPPPDCPPPSVFVGGGGGGGGGGPGAEAAVIVIGVQGMTCGGCAAFLEGALSKLPGVKEVGVSAATNRARLVFNLGGLSGHSEVKEAGTLEEVGLRAAKAVEGAGFGATLLEEKLEAPRAPRQQQPRRRLLVLSVEGMTCGSCASTVEAALAKLPGAEEASVSAVTHRATLSLPAGTTLEEEGSSSAALLALKAVEDVGFPARIIEDKLSGGGGRSQATAPAARRLVLGVEGMTCGACSATVEGALKKVPGVRQASVSAVTHRANVLFDPKTEGAAAAALQAIEDVGFSGNLLEEKLEGGSASRRGRRPKQRRTGVAGSRRVVLAVGGMTCGACAATVEGALTKVAGVKEASVSAVTHRAVVTFAGAPAVAAPAAAAVCSDAAKAATKAVEDVGFEASLVEESEVLGGVGGGDEEEDDDDEEAAEWLLCDYDLVGLTACDAGFALAADLEASLLRLPGVRKVTLNVAFGKLSVIADRPAGGGGGDEDSFVPEHAEAEAAKVGLEARAGAATPVLPASAQATVNVVARPLVGAGKGRGSSLRGSVGSAASSAGERISGLRRSLGGGRASERPRTVEEVARALPHVFGCRQRPCEEAEGVRTVTYDPVATSPRAIIDAMQAQLADSFSVEFISVSMDNEELRRHTRAMAELRRDCLRAAPFAVAVFVLTIVIPSAGIDLQDLGPLSHKVRNGADVLAFVILALATPVQFWVGRRFHSVAAKAIKRKAPNMDVLVSVATNTSYFYSLGLILFLLLSDATVSARALVESTYHFLTMGPILIAVVLFGKFVESRAKQAATSALTDLPSSMPSTATSCAPQGGDEAIPIELVELNGLLRVLAGAKVPVDGVMCSDMPVYVDESLLTGESTPIMKQRGDALLGGSTCLNGGCLMWVTRVGADTMLGQMVALVQEAQASKANVQRIADRIARYFVPVVIFIAFATFVVWTALVFSDAVDISEKLEGHGGHGGSDSEMVAHSMTGMGSDSSADHGSGTDSGVQTALKLLFAMEFGMAVLMIACPCAMGLATPMAVMVATGLAARRGCLVKTAAALECAAKLHAVVLDKTGTITVGAPAMRAAAISVEAFHKSQFLNKWRAFERRAQERALGKGEASTKKDATRTPPADVEFEVLGSAAFQAQEGAQEDIDAASSCFWWLLGTLESTSDHPVAKCISEQVEAMPGLPPIVAPKTFEYTSGKGMRSVVEELGDADVRVGTLRFFNEAVESGPAARGSPSPDEQELLDWVKTMQAGGNTVALMHSGGRPLGAVALRDPIREDSVWVVDYLQRRLGLEVWMCTGDNAATAHTIAAEVGIRNVVAEALPETKRATVEQVQARGKKVLFVGDGINDSLALSSADVGVAIGVGAQVAVDAADIALVRSELSDCVGFLSLSRRAFFTIMLNFFWAFCFNFVCLPIAAGVLYPTAHIPPLVAGMGMAGSSVLVVLTSLGLRLHRPPAPERRMPLPGSPKAAAHGGGAKVFNEALLDSGKDAPRAAAAAGGRGGGGGEGRR